MSNSVSLVDVPGFQMLRKKPFVLIGEKARG